MSNFAIYLTIFIVYMVAMICVSLVVFRRNKNLSDYILGGRQLNSWVAALSATASDMSSWMLLGLPGAAYATGVSAVWIPIGLVVGLYLAWRYMAPRLRIFTEYATDYKTGKKGDALTISSYLENRFEDRSHSLRLVSAIVIIIFFTIGVAAELVGGTLVFDILFDAPPAVGITITISVVMIYTFVGGFLAVSYTDSIQAVLMWIAALAVPVTGIALVGGFTDLLDKVSSRDSNLLSLSSKIDFSNSTWTSSAGVSVITIISGLAWAWGYFGQPHILARFMAIRTVKQIPAARRIGVSLSAAGLAAAIFTGLAGIAYFREPLSNPENVFLRFLSVFPTWLEALFLVGLLAALMSTASSMLLVAVAGLTQDIYGQFVNVHASEKKLLWVGRSLVVVLAVAACLIALQGGTVLDIVGFSWAGLGASFGTVLLLSLFWRNMNRVGAMAGMVGGGAAVLIYKQIDAIGLYEMVPGVLVSIAFVFLFNLFGKPPSETMRDDFEVALERTYGTHAVSE